MGDCVKAETKISFISSSRRDIAIATETRRVNTAKWSKRPEINETSASAMADEATDATNNTKANSG